MTSPRKIAVELVQYDQWLEPTSGYYEVLWTTPKKNIENTPGVNSRLTKSMDAAFREEFVNGRLGSAAVSASFMYDPLREWGVRTILLKVKALDREVSFWLQCMNFIRAASGETKEGRWVLLNFHSPLAQWRMDIVLQESKQIALPVYMDGLGCACLSVVTSDIRNAHHNLITSSGNKASCIFEVIAGQQLLEVCLARTPGGALLEFFQIRG